MVCRKRKKIVNNRDGNCPASPEFFLVSLEPSNDRGNLSSAGLNGLRIFMAPRRTRKRAADDETLTVEAAVDGSDTPAARRGGRKTAKSTPKKSKATPRKAPSPPKPELIVARALEAYMEAMQRADTARKEAEEAKVAAMEQVEKVKHDAEEAQSTAKRLRLDQENASNESSIHSEELKSAEIRLAEAEAAVEAARAQLQAAEEAEASAQALVKEKKDAVAAAEEAAAYAAQAATEKEAEAQHLQAIVEKAIPVLEPAEEEEAQQQEKYEEQEIENVDATAGPSIESLATEPPAPMVGIQQEEKPGKDEEMETNVMSQSDLEAQAPVDPSVTETLQQHAIPQSEPLQNESVPPQQQGQSPPTNQTFKYNTTTSYPAEYHHRPGI